MIDFQALLECLAGGRVRYILVGGFAATVHGAVRTTQDMNIVYDRDAANLSRLATALAPHSPYLRGAPPGLPFQLDADALQRGLNFTLITALGDLDLLGEITGGGGYGELIDHTVEVTVFGRPLRVLDLDTLIRTKQAAGRPKDLEAIAELVALREEGGT